MGDVVSIRVPCDLRYRNAVGALIQDLCGLLERQGEDPSLGFQVVSAFNEAFNNLVEYAYEPGHSGRPGAPAEVEVSVELDPGQLALSIEDNGRSFDFDGVASPDLGALPEEGLGIFIIRSCMTEVEYRPKSGSGRGNVLRMVKHLRAGRQQPCLQPPQTYASRGSNDDA